MKRKPLVSFELALLAGIACGSESHDQTKPANSSSSFEEMVDVGGYRLYINCLGKSLQGSPTIFMDAGGFDSSETWEKVRPEIARFARVCVYDRAGLGRSERRPDPSYPSQEVVNDLHKLLVNANIAGPYLLVGHSFGGMNVRLYASQYPKEVVGMVVVDSVHEDEMDRWVTMIPRENKQKMSKEDQAILAKLAVSEAQVRAAKWHSDIPLFVLSHGISAQDDYGIPAMAAQGEQLRIEMQRALAGLSSRSKHIIAAKSGHYIQRDQPELVIDAIRQVVEATRSENRKSF
ncbi:MAG: alpha/beta fold hydrolase [Pyrinomonadaceae bacterium]